MILDNIKVFGDKGRDIPYLASCTDKRTVTVKKEALQGMDCLTIDIPELEASKGDEGYYVIADGDNCGGQLVLFNDKADYEIICKQNIMPIFGVKNNKGTYLAVVAGMKYNFWLKIGVRSGKYYLNPIFKLGDEDIYEDVELDIYTLPKEYGFADIAKKYRQIQLEKENCRLIKDRCKDKPELKYAADSIEIRIRMGWKPAPPTVLEQTAETEPEMKVACTFDRVKDFVDELKAAGVDKAQLCLVGWNKSGHDGRYPDLFPVEEKLGGEEKLRELIAYAQKNGYQIICHTNSTDCYSISKDFSKDIVAKNPDGTLKMNDMPWSGGNMYHLCPQKALEFAKRDLPKVAELGFRGTHYIDVLSVLVPRTCCDKNHYVNYSRGAEIYEEIMKLSHQCFGGFSSEGCLDNTVKYLDYGLYVTFSENTNPFFDLEIPLWQIVYHGIVMSNPNTSTVNCSIKEKQSSDKLFAYGGRPSFYIYSKFLEGSNQDDWLGKDDLTIGTDEEMQFSVSKIKEVYDRYKDICHTQYETIEDFVFNENNIECTYSDGTKVTVDRF